MKLKLNDWIEQFVKYVQESYEEIKKVSWPSKETTIKLTIAVILISLFVAAFLGSCDMFFSAIIQRIINNF